MGQCQSSSGEHYHSRNSRWTAYLRRQTWWNDQFKWDWYWLKLFTEGKWQALVNLITKNNTSPSNEKLFGNQFYEKIYSYQFFSNFWIIDSRASTHVVVNIAFLKNVRDIPPWLVGLPNRKRYFAIKSGFAQLVAKLSLKNVLYIQQLKCHLLSPLNYWNNWMAWWLLHLIIVLCITLHRGPWLEWVIKGMGYTTSKMFHLFE